MAAVGIAYVGAGSSLRWRALAAVAFALLAIAVVTAMVGWGERMKRLRRVLSVGVLVASVVVFVVLVVMLLLDPTVQTTARRRDARCRNRDRGAVPRAAGRDDRRRCRGDVAAVCQS